MSQTLCVRRSSAMSAPVSNVRPNRLAMFALPLTARTAPPLRANRVHRFRRWFLASLAEPCRQRLTSFPFSRGVNHLGYRGGDVSSRDFLGSLGQELEIAFVDRDAQFDCAAGSLRHGGTTGSTTPGRRLRQRLTTTRRATMRAPHPSRKRR